MRLDTLPRLLHLSLVAATLAACGGTSAGETPVPSGPTSYAIFAGGCFWCTEADFEKVPGVVAVVSGYAGGKTVEPSYEEVSVGGTGHAEVVRVEFDPARVSYEELLEVFWRHVDPTTPDRQFCDHGDQYRSAIFYSTAAQKDAALASKAALERSKPFPEPIVTGIEAAGVFYPAEDYHQDYAKKNPVRYQTYRFACGRDRRLAELWGGEAASSP